MTERLFKVLGENGSPYHGGNGKWNLPTKNDDGTWTPGEWMPEIKGELIACKNGYHLCNESQLLGWLGLCVFEAEYRGERLDTNNKIVVREARLLRKYENWDERTARLLACDYAEHVLHTYYMVYQSDRPQQYIDTARRFANGEAMAKELTVANSLAWETARSFAGWNNDGNAIRYVARAVANVTARTVRNVVSIVAEDAFWAVVWWSNTALTTEYQWQTERLLSVLDA